MTRFATGWEKPAKKILPRSLLGRSLLIILVPLVVVQAVALMLFYGSHLDLISRRLAAAVAGEVAQTITLLEATPSISGQAWILRSADRNFELRMTLEPGATFAPMRQQNIIGPMDDDLRAALAQSVARPFNMNWTADPQYILIDVKMKGGVLHIVAPRKRLYTSMVYLFVVWVIGSSTILFAIAALFMRNQVRAIRRLAAAAEAFGLGRDAGFIRPEGAAEVRKAATAFNRMQERIRRFLAQRTEMLAGVSHDLRTPLTRLRLALAMTPAETPEKDEMIADLEEMERMISGYLSFARGEQSEQAQPTDLGQILADVAAGARRAGAAIDLTVMDRITVPVRQDAIRRAITNLVDNARRHASRIALSLTPAGRSVQVTVDDDGPGIPLDRRESVFRPFESDTAGGTGLGLTIARDIVRAHGGDILLEDSPLGGLRARIKLPV